MSKKRGSKAWIWWMLVLVAALAGVFFYREFLGSVNLNGKNYVYFYIIKGETFDQVEEELIDAGIVKDPKAFKWLASTMGLKDNIHPGRYRINSGMNLRQIINMLKSGKEEKVKLSYNYQITTIGKFIEYTDEKLGLTAEDLESAVYDAELLRQHFGLDPDCNFAAIVPGIYEVSWAISADDLMMLLRERYRKIWTPQRISQAEELGLREGEVITLASIVQCESSIRSEQEKIAGVYMNRLRANMPLQADPTLRFANSMFDAQRFWNSDKKTNSPYNTYKFRGLPPGPICLVYPQSIDATLNFMKHKYLYFCANPSLNGYSDFSLTLKEHEKRRTKYREMMDKRGIKR